MHRVTDKCRKCGLCLDACPVCAIERREGAVRIGASCVGCNLCARVCPFGAIEAPAPFEVLPEGAAVCSACPVQCRIPLGASGACGRYENRGGKLTRNRALLLENPLVPRDGLLSPVSTAVGAGTAYPCVRPAPFILSECRGGVDVVTVVTEAPLSYSGVTVKIDTNAHIGEERDRVFRGGREVGMVCTEEYGSKMLSIGGANRLTGKNGPIVARTIVQLANGEPVEVTIEKKVSIILQKGKAPVVDGVAEKKMRVGCGSATVGLFAARMKEAVDECIVVDHHVVGLFSEHLAGAEVGASWSGVIPNAKKSSRGRYFCERGDGIAGTALASPREAIRSVDPAVARVGIRILVVDTTGETYALFVLREGGAIEEIPMTDAALDLVRTINGNCESSLTSVMYVGGVGGSARGGVCRKPLALTESVHAGKSRLTVGGVPAYVMPGGGINFIVDAGKIAEGAFTWVPTPATVAPIEMTMTLADYEAIGGHLSEVLPVSSLREGRDA